ncbi:MAG: I78 family peptidase inhibitor [Sphingobium sp.]|nr:I78 family peptidase inhibitor [Sphingobium sp.]
MRHILSVASALALAACATTPPVTADGSCNHDSLARFTGQKASAETGTALLRASGAKTLRWGGPGMAMTMDFRPDRLTVSYDEAMLITTARCG